MASQLLPFLFLPAPALPVQSEPPPPPLILAIHLDADTLLARPALLAADVLALEVECGRQADFKLSEQGEVLAAGRLLPGRNPLRFARPGRFGCSQALVLLLELLENGAIARKELQVMVTVEGEAQDPTPQKAKLSGSFTLEMVHDGRIIGARKKSMADRIMLKPGPTMPTADPGRNDYFLRNKPESSSIPVLGMGLALIKYLAQKRTEKRLRAYDAETRKKRLSLTIIRGQRQVPITVELRTNEAPRPVGQ